MSIYKQKVFPSQYPPDVVDVIRLFSFKKAEVVGSSSLVSQKNAADYDLGEAVSVKTIDDFVKGFQTIIKNIYHTKGLFLGDIKCGRVVEWEVINPDAQVKDGKIEHYNPLESKRKLEALRSKRVITQEEYNEAFKLLGSTPQEFLVAKKEIKFDVVRWKYADVVAGVVLLRDGRKMELGEAIQTPGLCKVDAVGWVFNTRYTEFSCIYEVSMGGKVLNPVKEVLGQSLKNDMLYYASQGNYFKYAKRLFAYAKATDDQRLGSELTELLNSELGRLYQLAGDMGTIEWLVENESKLDDTRIRKELLGFKERISQSYDMKNPSDLLKTLSSMERLPPKGSQFLADLQSVKEDIERTYNLEAKKWLEEHDLLPIPKKYGAGIPSRKHLYEMVKNSYEEMPEGQIDDSKLVRSTNGLKFYQNGNDIIVAIRGTRWSDPLDLLADASIALNRLGTTDRFKRDLNDLKAFQNEYPPSQYHYYGVSHSLGGAILDLFLRLKLVKNGMSYNPAVQPLEILSKPAQQRIYNSQDPLYRLMGRFTKNPEVRESGQRQGLMEAHALKNFEGGSLDGLRHELIGAGLADLAHSLKPITLDEAKED
ncbi:hypothetical protein EBZ38_12935 [bacterium]|nr:hypothetical protein [bacterium]NBW78228.1 hypothetical protein [Betaproteobacteria bacterium]NDC95400.1 hypothetical protein [bacterium]NDD85162.1 hypothetical protein [bacterium]